MYYEDNNIEEEIQQEIKNDLRQQFKAQIKLDQELLEISSDEIFRKDKGVAPLTLPPPVRLLLRVVGWTTW